MVATLRLFVSQRFGAPRTGVAYRHGSCVVSKFEVDLNASRPVGIASAVISQEVVDGQGRPRAKICSRSDSTKEPWSSLPREYLHCVPSRLRHRDLERSEALPSINRAYVFKLE
jgi:hypothetical protein